MNFCIKSIQKNSDVLKNISTFRNNRPKHLKTGFIVGFCYVFAKCNEDDLARSEIEVKCSAEVKAKPQKDDRFHHHYSDEDFDEGPGFFGQAPRQSARKTNYCVNIPRRPSRDSGSRAITEFAWKLFKNSNTQENFVLSPLNPQLILSYLAWIAEGKT